MKTLITLALLVGTLVLTSYHFEGKDIWVGKYVFPAQPRYVSVKPQLHSGTYTAAVINTLVNTCYDSNGVTQSVCVRLGFPLCTKVPVTLPFVIDNKTVNIVVDYQCTN